MLKTDCTMMAASYPDDVSTPSILVVRETVCFDAAAASKRSRDDSCYSQSKRQRFSETLPPSFPILPDCSNNENEADVIAGFEVPTLNLSMKKRSIDPIHKPAPRRVSVSPLTSVEPLLQGMSLEESWSMDTAATATADYEEPGLFPATPKPYQILPRPSQQRNEQQESGDAALPLPPPLTRTRSSLGFPDTIFLPELMSP